MVFIKRHAITGVAGALRRLIRQRGSASTRKQNETGRSAQGKPDALTEGQATETISHD
jgi:hypothetical protein